MSFLESLGDIAFSGLAGVLAGVIPDHVKRRALARLDDRNPFKSISANHDLVRATRLAWIEAAQDVIAVARSQASSSDWRGQSADIVRFADLIDDALLDSRDHALDRRKSPGPSPIDAHVQAVIDGVPELMSPGEHVGIGASVTDGFPSVLAGLTGWPPNEVPSIFGDVARTGLPLAGGGQRAFGELVFAAFAELIKDPKKYPQAREAFYVAMDKLARDIGKATLDAVAGLDARLDATIGSLDGLKVLRAGAIQYLDLLPGLAGGIETLKAGQGRIEETLAQNSAVLARVLAAVEARGDVARAQDGGLERAIVIKLAKRIRPEELLDFDQAVAALEQLIDTALDVIAKGNRPSNEDAFVSDVLKTVAAYTLEGENEQASRAVDDALRELDRRAQEQAEALRQSRLTLTRAGFEQDSLRRNAPAAARRVLQIVELENAGADHERLFAALRSRQDEFYERGRDKGNNFDLLIAIELARLTQDIAIGPDQRGAASNDLAIALNALGDRESGTERLEQAADTYRIALNERSRERVPLDWARTQNNLGNTLSVLGQRETGTERLKQAVDAFRAALSEATRERVPLEWAKIQSNLGATLRLLGERETGTESLEQAVEAFRAALTERTRDRVPLDWAITQNNLGNALQTLGERESGTGSFEQAVNAYRAALAERTRDQVPFTWAMIQHNLGSALQAIGQRDNGTEGFEQAVVAYRAALDVFTEAKAEYYVTGTADTLAKAEALLAERRRQT